MTKEVVTNCSIDAQVDTTGAGVKTVEGFCDTPEGPQKHYVLKRPDDSVICGNTNCPYWNPAGAPQLRFSKIKPQG